jgi:AcrR family transcriptional regulator
MTARPAKTPDHHRPRSDRRRARARADMTAAARALIAEKGVEGLRIGDVTERADVAFGTFYTHFETKTDVIEAVVTGAISGLADALIALPASLEDPAERMSVAIRGIVRLAYEDREVASLLVNLDRAEARLERMVGSQARIVIDRGIETGRFRVHDLPTLLVFTISGCFGAMRGILEDRLGEDADVTCAAAIMQALGLGYEEAIEIAARPLPPIAPPAGSPA